MREGFLLFLQFSALVATSRLFDYIYLPDNRLSAWPAQVSFFAQLAACLCLLIRCGVIVASFPVLDRGKTWTCGSVQKAAALLMICHHMSHLRLIYLKLSEQLWERSWYEQFGEYWPDWIHPFMLFPFVCYCGQTNEQLTAELEGNFLSTSKRPPKIPAQRLKKKVMACCLE